MLLTLSLPPGAYRLGTNYQAAGRYYDVNRVRWVGRSLAPIGGWRAKTASTVTGLARAILPWRDNSKVTRVIIGTNSNLYAMSRAGVLTDITPAGFVAGAADSVAAAGYGRGDFGEDLYGTPRADSADIQDAAVWTLDTRGEIPIGCIEADGKIYSWDLNTSNDAVQISNSPTAAACFVTNEGAVVALGAGGEPKRVEWADAEVMTDWTASATDTAGGQNLQTYGSLRCGKRIRGANLLWTDLDLWIMRPTFDQLVYGFECVGTACGVISKQAVAAIDEKAVWMGPDGFFLYNGAVQPLPCEVSDRVFEDFNALQGAKVYAVRLSKFSEVWWFYPSNGSSENDRYVLWNYETGAWSFGALGRTCGADRGVFQYPLMVDASGAIWEHEVGHAYSDGIMPHAEGGPIEIGGGDQVMRVTKLYPDEALSGDVTVSFKIRFQPNSEEMTKGPYTLQPKTDVRFTARQVAVRYEGVRLTGWRVGGMRMDATAAGLR